VVLDNGEVIAQTYVVVLAHVEGLWIKPERRGGRLMKMLSDQVEKLVAKFGVPALYAFKTPANKDYLERLGWSETGWSVMVKK